MHVVGTSCVVDAVGEVARWQHVVLECWINLFFSRMALNCSTVLNGFIRVSIQALLKSLLGITSSLQITQPCLNWSMRRRREFWGQHRCQNLQFNCSVFFSKYRRIMLKQSCHLLRNFKRALVVLSRFRHRSISACEMVSWLSEKMVSALMSVSVLLSQQVSLHCLQFHRCGYLWFLPTFPLRIRSIHLRP